MYKSLIASSAVLLLCLGLALTNSIVTLRILSSIEAEAEAATTYTDFKGIHDGYMNAERFLSICIPDSSLSEIEGCLSDVLSSSSLSSENELKTAKSRLLCLLRQQKRLCGFNIKSIF